MILAFGGSGFLLATGLILCLDGFNGYVFRPIFGVVFLALGVGGLLMLGVGQVMFYVNLIIAGGVVVQVLFRRFVLG